jgi:hypothetical protein
MKRSLQVACFGLLCVGLLTAGSTRVAYAAPSNKPSPEFKKLQKEIQKLQKEVIKDQQQVHKDIVKHHPEDLPGDQA